jgi:hypothetical protein
MASVDSFDSVWVTSPSLQSGERIGLVLFGARVGDAVGLNAWSLGRGRQIVKVENFQVTDTNLIQFEVVNVGPDGSLVDALNLAFSFVSQ